MKRRSGGIEMSIERLDLTTLRRLYSNTRQEKYMAEIASRYKSVQDFKKFDLKIFESARRRGILEQITKHMPHPFVPQPHYGRKDPAIAYFDRPPLVVVGAQIKHPHLRVVTHYISGSVPDKEVPQHPFGRCLLWDTWITAFPWAEELEEHATDNT